MQMPKIAKCVSVVSGFFTSNLSLLGLLLMTAVGPGVPVCHAGEDMVVIVNAANPAASISAADLKKMFLGDKTAWPGGAKVLAATPAPDSADYGAAIKKVTGMSAGDFKRYMMQMSFVGKIVPIPRGLESSAALAHFVASAPGAVGCAAAGTTGPGVKVIKVD